MSRSSSGSWSPRLVILNDKQKEDVHLASLEILRRTGVRVFSAEARGLLAKAGCTMVEEDTVRIPSHLIEQAIRSAPPSVTVYDRNGNPAMRLEGTNIHFGTGSDLPNVVDPHSGERRQSLKKDIADAAKLCDALPNIDFLMSMSLPADVPIATSDVHSFEAMVTSSTKPVVYTAHDRQGLSDIIEMASVVAGGLQALRQRPFMALFAEFSSPLQHSEEAIEKLLLAAENDLPVVYSGGPLPGASGPATMAGTMALANAELLSGLLISQLKRPGMPFIFGSGTAPLDMHTTVALYAAPEHLLASSAMVEMGRHYKLPTWSYAGCADSKVFDEQAALEGAMWSLMGALNGANLMHDVGYLESGLTSSFEMMAVMDEVIGMCRRIMEGIAVDDETLALDVVDEAGPGGHFLYSEHTLKHYKENWYPSLLDRHNYSDWEALGKKDLRERAGEKVRSILRNHQPEALPGPVIEKLGQIVRRADERVRKL